MSTKIAIIWTADIFSIFPISEMTFAVRCQVGQQIYPNAYISDLLTTNLTQFPSITQFHCEEFLWRTNLIFQDSHRGVFGITRSKQDLGNQLNHIISGIYGILHHCMIWIAVDTKLHLIYAFDEHLCAPTDFTY